MFDQINTMIDFDVNMINDELIVKTKFVDHHINSNKVDLYKFLLKFYEDDKFEDISEKKVYDILYATYKGDSSLLTKEDYSLIENRIKEFNLINNSIEDKVSELASLRGIIKSEQDRIEKFKSTLDKSTREDLFNETDEIIKKLKVIRKQGNFFVHLKESGDKYKDDLKDMKKVNKLFGSLKEDIKKANSSDSVSEIMNEEYIDILSDMLNSFQVTIKKANSFKTK